MTTAYPIAVLGDPLTTLEFLRILPSLQKYADLKDVFNANGVPKFTDTRVDVQFGSTKVSFITSTDRDDGLSQISKSHSNIYSVFIVFESSSATLATSDQTLLRNMFAHVPRAAFSNVCIVNIFDSPIIKQDAMDQCESFLKEFCKQHELANPCEYMVISKSITTAIVSPSEWIRKTKARSDFIPKESRELYIDMRKDLMAVIDGLKDVQSVTAKALEVLECWKRIGQSIMPRRKIEESTVLLSCLSENIFTPLTIASRKDDKKEGKLLQDDYISQVEIWDKLDKSVSIELRQLCQLEFGVVIPDAEVVPDPVTSPSPYSIIDRLKNISLATTTLSKTPKKVNQNGSTLTVYITGSSHSDKTLLLNTINLTHLHKTFDDALKNGKRIEFNASSNDYIIDYKTHKIRFVSKESFKDVANLDDDQVHGFIFTVENSAVELAPIVFNEIRESYQRLPRSRYKNACLGCIFTEKKDVKMETMNKLIDEAAKAFQTQHGLPTAPRHCCIDKTLVQQIFQHEVDKNSEEKAKASYEMIKSGISRFIETVGTVEPVTSNDLQVADNWKRLCDAFRSYRNGDNPETLRLMATIAENALTGLAIHCRKKKGDAYPLCRSEWPAAIAHWKSDSKYKDIAEALQQL